MKKQPKKLYLSAFTLVELIVVIVILSILATIAFLSFNSYSSNSRDSVRLSDINNINKSLEIFNINAAKYPDPTNIYMTVMYNWWVIFEQGKLWDTVITNIQKISKKPIDPLTSKEYIYSVNITNTSYQLKADMESKPTIWYNWVSNWKYGIENVFKTTYADWNSWSICYIKWNFNWLMEKTNTWNTNYILAIPWLVISDTWSQASNINIDYNTLSGKVLCNWYNYPCIITYTPTVVFAWTWNTVPTTSSEIEEIMVKLQSAYSWSNSSSSNPTISNLLNSTWTALVSLWSSMVSKVGVNSVWGGVEIPIGSNDCSAWNYSWAWTQTYSLTSTLSDTNYITWTTNITIDNWTKTYSAKLTCNSWSMSVSNESVTWGSCNSGYNWNWWTTSCDPNACWTSNGQFLSTTPSTNLCWAWVASSVVYSSSGWSYTWTCWWTANCKAYDNYTVSLLHFDWDISDLTGKTWTKYWWATTLTDANTKLWFWSSLRIPTKNTDYLKTNSNWISDFQFWTSDYTIDFWAWITADDGTSASFFINFVDADSASAATWRNLAIYANWWWLSWWYYNTSLTPASRYNYGYLNGVFNYSSPTRNHIALVKNWTSAKLYLNWNEIKTVTNSDSIINFSKWLYIWRRDCDARWWFVWYMDEVRISKWIARRTSNFTPPTSPY